MVAPAREGRLTVSRLFVYGTLMHDTVVQELLGHRPFGRPGVLKGYRRAFDPAIGYPVIHPEHGAAAAGKLIDVTPEDLTILDDYEGARYRRIIVRVETIEGRVLDAYVYVPVGS